MTIYEKLMNVQSKLKAPKGQYNSFGKYSYRSCEDILEALKPIFKKEKLAIFISDEMVLMDTRFYVKATVTLVDIETGEKVMNSAFAREEENKKGMDGSQVTGASSSYARKYALNGMFAIDDTKDSDSTNTHGKDDKAPTKTQSKSSNNELTENQIKRLYAIANKAKITPNQVIEVCNKSYCITDVKKLNKQQYDNVCKRLESKIK